MLLTMSSARLPCSAIFSRLPVSMLHRVVDLGALVLVERGESRRGGLLQLVEQLDRQAGEVVDEVERVLDLVRDAGGELARARPSSPPGSDWPGRPSGRDRRLRRVAGGADFRLDCACAR